MLCRHCWHSFSLVLSANFLWNCVRAVQVNGYNISNACKQTVIHIDVFVSLANGRSRYLRISCKICTKSDLHFRMNTRLGNVLEIEFRIVATLVPPAHLISIQRSYFKVFSAHLLRFSVYILYVILNGFIIK